MTKNRTITVQDIPIGVFQTDIDDYICITDMAAVKAGNSRSAADLLNIALFGFTAKAWREENPELAKKSKIRKI